MNALRVVVLGYIIRGPLGGLAWHHLQYVIGLARLGHDVYFLEDSEFVEGDGGGSCYDPTNQRLGDDPSYGIRFAAAIFDKAGMGDRWCYYDAFSSRWLGPLASDIIKICSSADILLNLSGVNPLRPWLTCIQVRALVDTDPVFMQIRHLQNPAAHELASRHNVFFSFGENIQGTAAVPDDGFPWRKTRQPIVLDQWPVTNAPVDGRFTTIMNWESYPPANYDGLTYGMKSHSFAPYMDLPRKMGPRFELAVGASAPSTELGEAGWILSDPHKVACDPWMYQTYLQRSKAEFSVAKHGYVVSRSGWFSERTACYLASGRPALVQDTGFSEWLRGGEGVVAFTNLNEAIAGAERIISQYQLHCTVARQIAETHFDSTKVIDGLLSNCFSWVEKSERLTVTAGEAEGTPQVVQEGC
jgi:hypothetical protein